jgi:hypothetical protein
LLGIAAVACALFFLGSAGLGSTKTYNHGKTVWFSDVTIGEGDEVRGDLDIIFGSVTCAEGGQIDGNVRNYFGSFENLDGCTIGGRVIDAFDNNGVAMMLPAVAPQMDFIGENRKILEKLAWDVVIVLMFLLFPLRARVALDRLEHHPGLSAAAGAGGLILSVPLFLLLLVSVIGIPLIVLEIAAIFAGLWIGQAAIALLIGRRLHEALRPHNTPTPFAALILGLVVVTAAQVLPVIGWAVSAIVWLVGFGAVLLGFVRESSFRSFTGAPPVTGTRPNPQL